MASKAIIVLLDIEIPDNLEDEEYDGEGIRLSRLRDEIDKIIRDGCIEEGFNWKRIDYGLLGIDFVYDLETQ